MTLEALRKDMVAAMKAKDKTTKDAVSSLVSAVKKAAIDVICTPFTGHPVKGVFLCVILTNLRKKLLNCIAKENGLMHPMI